METIDKGIPVPSGVNRLKVSTMVTGIPLNGNHRQGHPCTTGVNRLKVSTMVTGKRLYGNHRQGHPCTIRGKQTKGQYHGNRYTSLWKP